MPIIDMPVDMLMQRLSKGDDEHELGVDELAELLPRMGCEVEEVAEMQEYLCRICGKIYDRTEAQGPPLLCSNCGADFRENPAQLDDLGVNTVLRLDMLAVRPDIFDPGGMARYIRGFLGIETGLTIYNVGAARLRVQVDPALANDDSYRPFIACAVVRNVQLDHNTIKMVMNLQEDLHWALGRDRKLASIGVYDLDTLAGEVFRYDAVDPDGVRFVPLGYAPDEPDSLLTPREILEQHKTGQAYAHLLKPLRKYPLLRDGEGQVLSMPPIINSEGTRVTLNTNNFFIDVTGTSQRTVDRALNVLVTSLKEILPAIEVECVIIERGDDATMTPDLTPATMELDVRRAVETIGADLNAGQLGELLESMGYGVEEAGHADSIKVLVPAYRNDVMHPIDLIEDAAIAFGYENLPAELVPTFTIGAPRETEEASAVARRIMTGLGFHQVMTLVLTNEEQAFGRFRTAPHPEAVRIENPISSEQTICRVSILPGLLHTLSINKQYDLPQYLFELGDCCFCSAESDTGAREERFLAAAMIGTHIGYADIRAVTDAFVHEMGRAVQVRPVDHPSFIPGRAAELCLPAGAPLGVMGELHPEVLEHHGLKHPVAVMEMSFARLMGIHD